MTNIESTTWLDLLPTEIIFLICNYLSNNDVIYTFTDFSQRSKNLLLENQPYLTTLVLPTTNLDIWKNILLIIGSKIKCLIIEIDELTIPLEYFPNLKSIVHFLPYGSSDEQIKLIVESNEFKNFDSLKIKADKSFRYGQFYGSAKNQNFILDKVFTNRNSLKTFQYIILSGPSKPINTNNFVVNFSLHSLKLILFEFDNIFQLIRYTPHLKYLNIYSKPPSKCRKLINNININLKEFHLKLTDNISYYNLPYMAEMYIDDLLIDVIKQFSSSLICLSLDLINLSIIRSIDTFPFNITKLQDLLESMKELKQFHLCAQINKINNSQFDNNFILSEFRNEYWFNHNWSFGMHGKYLYTLPFHFNDLHEFPNNFNNFKSNNPDILESNSRIWFNVESLELSMAYPYDINFVRELKIKMPKLNFIEFSKYCSSLECETQDLYSNNEKRNKCDVTLNRVRTIQLTGASNEQINQWLINSLPNVKHLILSWTDWYSMDKQLAEISNKRIEELDIIAHCKLDDLPEISSLYFPNVEFINFRLSDGIRRTQCYANIVMKMLANFKNLKTLLIYPFHKPERNDFNYETFWSVALKRLNMEELGKNYELKHYEDYCRFSKIFS